MVPKDAMLPIQQFLHTFFDSEKRKRILDIYLHSCNLTKEFPTSEKAAGESELVSQTPDNKT